MSQNLVNNTKPESAELYQIEQRIGRTLRSVRIDKGLSMRELARAAGTSHQQIHKIERGLNRLTFSRFHIFMKHLNISPRSFYEAAFETDWEEGAKLENSSRVKLYKFIRDLDEEQRLIIFNIAKNFLRTNKIHKKK